MILQWPFDVTDTIARVRCVWSSRCTAASNCRENM